MANQSAYEQIAAHILTQIENNPQMTEAPWMRMAHTGMPTNFTTNNRYQGLNVLSLWVACEANGFTNSQWGTYKQWASVGAQVRKGSKSTPIIFFSELSRENADGETDRIPFAKVSRVFNIDQVDGVELPQIPSENKVKPVAAADELFHACGAQLVIEGFRAFYRPADDTIHMPPGNLFLDTSTGDATQNYYAVLLHELVHWTGHRSRLDRLSKVNKFETIEYAHEELIADLGAAFLCAELGLEAEPRPDHACYLSGYLKALKNEPRAFFKAASEAGKAATYLTGHPHTAFVGNDAASYSATFKAA